MKSLYKVVAFVMLATFVLSACSPAAVDTPVEAEVEVVEEAAPADSPELYTPVADPTRHK